MIQCTVIRKQEVGFDDRRIYQFRLKFNTLDINIDVSREEYEAASVGTIYKLVEDKK